MTYNSVFTNFLIKNIYFSLLYFVIFHYCLVCRKKSIQSGKSILFMLIVHFSFENRSFEMLSI